MARAKVLNYEELIEYAKKYYEQGGDGVYECWDERTYNSYVEMFGPITKSKALQMFRMNKAIYDESRAAARYFGGEW